MKRLITVAAAQLGPIQRAEGRDVVVARMVRLLERAHQRGANVVVFPELALTTFFPRWYVENLDEADGWYEETLPSPATQPLFDAIRRYGLTCYLGYAEIAHEPDEQGVMRKRRFNTSVVIAPPTSSFVSRTDRTMCSRGYDAVGVRSCAVASSASARTSLAGDCHTVKWLPGSSMRSSFGSQGAHPVEASRQRLSTVAAVT